MCHVQKFDIIISLLKTQRYLKVRKKKTKILKNLNFVIAALNEHNDGQKLHCVLPLFPYAQRVFVSLVSYNIVFSFYLWNASQEINFSVVTVFKREQTIVEVVYGVVFLRRSLVFGSAFTSLKSVSHSSRRLYFTYKAFQQLFTRSANKSARLYLFNSNCGVVDHKVLLQARIGGNLALICY